MILIKVMIHKIHYHESVAQNMSLSPPADTANFQQVLLTLIQGAVEIPDPQGQKTCFNILKRLVEVWGETRLTTTYHTIRGRTT